MFLYIMLMAISALIGMLIGCYIIQRENGNGKLEALKQSFPYLLYLIKNNQTKN